MGRNFPLKIVRILSRASALVRIAAFTRKTRVGGHGPQVQSKRPILRIKRAEDIQPPLAVLSRERFPNTPRFHVSGHGCAGFAMRDQIPHRYC
jgi:hypothetical protein